MQTIHYIIYLALISYQTQGSKVFIVGEAVVEVYGVNDRNSRTSYIYIYIYIYIHTYAYIHIHTSSLPRPLGPTMGRGGREREREEKKREGSPRQAANASSPARRRAQENTRTNKQNVPASAQRQGSR